MHGGFHIRMNEPLRLRRHRDEAHLVALALNAKVHDTFAPLIIAHAQLTELLPPDAVKEQRGYDSPVTNPFERVRRRGLEEGPGLRITERRRRAFVVISLGALDTLHRVMRHGVAL